MFTLLLITYLFCQRAEFSLALPRPFVRVTLALPVGSTTWLRLAARGLFDDSLRQSRDVKHTPSRAYSGQTAAAEEP